MCATLRRYSRVFSSHLASAKPHQWLLAARSGSREGQPFHLVPGADGPQPGGALLRLDVLREYQRNCTSPEVDEVAWPYMSRNHHKLAGVADYSWWRCVYLEARASSHPQLRRMIANQETGMGEMRVYKFVELVTPSAWMELPCHVHLDTQTLFDAMGLDAAGKTAAKAGRTRACAIPNASEVAVAHGAAGGSEGGRMAGISSELAKRLRNCVDTNQSTTRACWELARAGLPAEGPGGKVLGHGVARSSAPHSALLGHAALHSQRLASRLAPGSHHGAHAGHHSYGHSRALGDESEDGGAAAPEGMQAEERNI